jgi:hypothetical protein
MKKQINFDENVLLCPTCNGNYLHQSTVGIYNCDEDAKTGLHLEIDSKGFTMDTLMKDNPSPRRHGLSILFYCEYCDGEDVPSHILNIYQHKGQTIMEWEGI